VGEFSREARTMINNHKKDMAEEAIEEKMDNMASKRVSGHNKENSTRTRRMLTKHRRQRP
jgi:hypothetical protein